MSVPRPAVLRRVAPQQAKWVGAAIGRYHRHQLRDQRLLIELDPVPVRQPASRVASAAYKMAGVNVYRESHLATIR